MLLGLETFSYHLAFAYRKMNIFDFIKRTAELGLDGVEILVEGADLGLWAVRIPASCVTSVQ